MNLKSLIKKGFETRDKGFDLLGGTIQKAAESVGFVSEDRDTLSKLTEDIANDPALNKKFLAVLRKDLQI